MDKMPAQRVVMGMPPKGCQWISYQNEGSAISFVRLREGSELKCGGGEVRVLTRSFRDTSDYVVILFIYRYLYL